MREPHLDQASTHNSIWNARHAGLAPKQGRREISVMVIFPRHLGHLASAPLPWWVDWANDEVRHAVIGVASRCGARRRLQCALWNYLD